MGADALEQEVHRQRIDIAALAVQQGAFAVFMYVLGHPRVDTGAGDGQCHPAVDINGVHGELRAVPQVLGIPELLGVVAEVLQKIVAGAHGDHGHSRVVIADDAVGHLVHRAVAAAGVEPQLLAAFTQLLCQLRGVPLLLCQDALHIQPVLLPQRIRHVVDLLPAVGLPRRGVDNKNMLHRGSPPHVHISVCRFCLFYQHFFRESEQIENKVV